MPKQEHQRFEFADDSLAGLTWGMGLDAFRGAYTRSSEITQPLARRLQDISVVVYGLEATTGFEFSSNGLSAVVVSFLFVQQGRRLNHQEVLSRSEDVFARLRHAYGTPDVSVPWDGTKMNYIWLLPDTIVQFAWDGGSSWGVHHRSAELDPIARAMLDQVK